MNSSIRKTLHIGALGTFVCEALMEDLLTDDRVVKRYDIIRGICLAELQRVANISEVAIKSFGSMCDTSPKHLMSHSHRLLMRASPSSAAESSKS